MSNGPTLAGNRQYGGHGYTNNDEGDIYNLYSHVSNGVYGQDEPPAGARTPTAASPRPEERTPSMYDRYESRPMYALPPSQTQQSRYHPPPAAAPHNGRFSGSRSRPLPAPPAIQPSPGAPINSSSPQYHHHPHRTNEPISPETPLKSHYTRHVQGSLSSLVSTQHLGSNQLPPHRGEVVDSQHGHSNGSQRSGYDYSGTQQSYGDPYQSGHRPPRISVPELTVDNLEPTPAHHRQSQTGGHPSHTPSIRRDYDPRRMPVAPISPPAGAASYYPPDGTSSSSQNGGYHYASDPRVMQHRQQPSYTAGRSSPTAPSPVNRSPIVVSPPADGGDEGSSGVGAALMRSPSAASSFASAGSLLQEPHRASVQHGEYTPSPRESPTPTPTNPSRNLPGSSLHPPFGEDFSRSSAVSSSNSAGSYAYPPVPSMATSPDVGSSRRKGGEYRRMACVKGPLELHDDGDESDDPDDIDELRFVNLSLLSHVANLLKNKVPRGTHVKGGIPYSKAFTGKDVVSTIQTYIQKEYQSNAGIPLADRKLALQVARSLQSQLFFYEVEWGGRKLTDGVEDVYMFLDEGDDNDGGGNSDAGGIPGERRSDVGRMDREELPTGVITLLTRCYSPSCAEAMSCYSYSCPRRASPHLELQLETAPSTFEPPADARWADLVDPEALRVLSEKEKRRQTIIFQVIVKERQYVQDLDFVESCFIKGLRRADPPVIPPQELDEFIEEVFGNISELRQCNRRLLDVLSVRQREQQPVIQRIGDVFLNAAADFRGVYPVYVGHLPVAEKRIKEEMESNAEFRRFLELCMRSDPRRLELKHFISRPAEHLQKYPLLLEAIFKETEEGSPDADFLLEAESAIRNLYTVAQLRTFQNAMGRGPTNKLEWHDLVPKDVRAGISKQESKRQSIIWELIKGEMIYVKDLETIETLFIRPLRNANIIPRERLPAFLHDVFHNFAEIHAHHRRMLDRLHEIQREEHPVIRTIVPPVFDAALNWVEAYMEYIPHYPIAAFRIDDEMANNQSFKAFIDQCIRHPDSRKLDLKAFINRPIPRLLRYELLLKGIMEASPPNHEDRDTIPQVLEVIKDLGKRTEPGVQSAKDKVELWGYHANLVFKPGEMVDMDLLNDTRTLIHTGKLLRQPETGFEWSGWTELFVLLFDNYMVMTKTKEKDGITKYHVNRRPIPLDLLSLLSFNEPPQQRSTGLLRSRGTRNAHGEANPVPAEDSRSVYPLQIHHNGRMGGVYGLYAESPQARDRWKEKLEEALGMRKVVQESNKVFEIETLSLDTFLVPSMHHNSQAPSWNEEGMFTGRVTCSVPFTTSDGRGLVAIGCAEGVWIGLRHDSRSMRRVLHLKMVTQCAMLEDFGIFLVLADKSLFAYHIEALVPSNPPSPHATRTPQKLNGNKDVQFFSVGQLGGRTLIIYMKKKSMDSVFRVLEPVVERINDRSKTAAGFGRFTFGSNRSEWFRVYRDFFLPSEAFDLIFLKAKIAILCTKGFEIMDLTDLSFKSVSIPQKDDPRLASFNKRFESCKPLGMFRCSENEFLLCYDEFGMYVDRHGDPSRPVITVEWEGTAERVAYHPPYVLLFDPRFIEIRHVDTGRLAQIIPGNDVRCLWDGRGASIPPAQTPGPDGWEEGGAQDARVHATMRAEEPPHGLRVGTQPRGVAQHVFELLPTIPLYLPGSLSSPSQSTYFPQTSSPPHSPRLRPIWSR